MEAIEFQTTLGNDGIISIPSDVSSKVRSGKVRVIVIEEEPQIFDDDTDPKSIKNYIKLFNGESVQG